MQRGGRFLGDGRARHLAMETPNAEARPRTPPPAPRPESAVPTPEPAALPAQLWAEGTESWTPRLREGTSRLRQFPRAAVTKDRGLGP